MRSATRFRPRLFTLVPILAVAIAMPVAQASAHGRVSHGFYGHGFYASNAIVSGTVTSLGTGSFDADAYVVTPGPGNSGPPSPTPGATILVGSSTKVITYGDSGIKAGDAFYAVYKGVSSSTTLATLETDTPSVVYAYVAPTPEVEVRGVVTTAPASGSDQFTATAYVVTPPHPEPYGWGDPGGPQPGYSSQNASFGQGYSYGGGIGGGYGWGGAAVRGPALRSYCLPVGTPVSQGTPDTTITTDTSTSITINGKADQPVSDLADGDTFTAVFDGTPNDPLSTITATPAISITAWTPPTPYALYAFVGTVAATTAPAGTTPGSISVTVTSSDPSGLFTGTDKFTVGPTTLVFGDSTSSLFGSLSGVSVGDVVAGGLISQGGQTASAIEADPLQILVDFPAAVTPGVTTASIRHRDLKKALALLGKEKVKLDKHGKKHKKK
jgi:hypothetical protein